MDKLTAAYTTKFTEAANSYPPWLAQTPDKQAMIIRRLIRSIRNHSIVNTMDFAETESIFQMHLLNFNPNSSIKSSYYIDSLISGSIDPKDIGDATSQFLNPQASANERAEIENRLGQKIEKKYAKQPCKNCKSYTVIRQETTGHSLGGDEIGGFRFDCTSCGKHWNEK